MTAPGLFVAAFIVALGSIVVTSTADRIRSESCTRRTAECAERTEPSRMEFEECRAARSACGDR